MNFNKIAPFGKEDTAKELQDHAKTQDTLVDVVENAEAHPGQLKWVLHILHHAGRGMCGGRRPQPARMRTSPTSPLGTLGIGRGLNWQAEKCLQPGVNPRSFCLKAGQAIDAYNDPHHYRAENPLAHLQEDEAPVETDKLKSFHDPLLESTEADPDVNLCERSVALSVLVQEGSHL
eukprot:CAMPEP_0171058020 /NCGR_PEP_ID=MMETSP0766_2-20121228/2205_1 /TAXON_ID=439317 /ORGANISM="Gambierdiscus australes, Strain CAWD 149" /LENGTH=175 /DNA_ID=CAMNT_0011513233 /DNA_START=1 /DNA_END=526 /DNA_ORIENTATION=+